MLDFKISIRIVKHLEQYGLNTRAFVIAFMDEYTLRTKRQVTRKEFDNMFEVMLLKSVVKLDKGKVVMVKQ